MGSPTFNTISKLLLVFFFFYNNFHIDLHLRVLCTASRSLFDQDCPRGPSGVMEGVKRWRVGDQQHNVHCPVVQEGDGPLRDSTHSMCLPRSSQRTRLCQKCKPTVLYSIHIHTCHLQYEDLFRKIYSYLGRDIHIYILCIWVWPVSQVLWQSLPPRAPQVVLKLKRGI